MNFFGGRRFGYVGEAIIGDIGFDQPYSAHDWRSSTWQTGPMSWFDFSAIYTPMPTAVLDVARAQWEKLQDLVSLKAPSAAKAEARMSNLRNTLAPLIAKIDGLSSGSQLQPRAIYFVSINNYLTALANENWPVAAEEIEHAEAQQATAAAAAVAAQAKLDAAAKEAAARAAETQAKQDQTHDSIVKAQAAIDAAAKAKMVAQGAALAHQQAQQAAVAKRAALGQSLSTPLTIAAVAIPLAVVAYFALRKKSSSVGRYRRRRR